MTKNNNNNKEHQENARHTLEMLNANELTFGRRNNNITSRGLMISSLSSQQQTTGDTYYAISQLLKKKRDYDLAIASLEDCLRIRGAIIVRFSEEVASTLLQVGIVQSQTAAVAEAINTWDEAISTYNRAGFQEDHVNALNVKEHQENVRHTLEMLNKTPTTTKTTKRKTTNHN